jgi:fused signal recognition particle receptor
MRAGLARTRERLSAALGLVEPGAASDWDRLEQALLEADVGVAATAALLAHARSSRSASVAAALRDSMTAILKAAETRVAGGVSARPEVVLVVGVNGVGKTTTVAKLARRSLAEGGKPLLIGADTFRAAALEQLETWAERLNVPLVRGKPGGDSAGVVHDGLSAALARGADQVFIDTAGRLHTRVGLMEELAKLKRVAAKLVEGAPHQSLLVMDATVGGNGLVQARVFSERLGLTGIVLTKMDGTARGGVVLAVAKELGLPVRFTGTGEAVEDFQAFSCEDFVGGLLDSSD